VAGAALGNGGGRDVARQGVRARNGGAGGLRRSGGDEGRPVEGHHRDGARLVRDEGGSGRRPTRALSRARSSKTTPAAANPGQGFDGGKGHGANAGARCQETEPVKTFVKMIVVVSALSSVAMAAEVDRREDRQQARIAEGVQSGQMTAGETARIERQEQRIDN